MQIIDHRNCILHNTSILVDKNIPQWNMNQMFLYQNKS